ncbi:hypothetical protein [[Clostridium] colinum]|uniref:hypothetical protein n=1 Tax=[Clostridium] colinum TaxID=36835 RepID=UPI002023FD55|nr:hypothetical protein [[Clostridium] colinum]
MDIILNSIMLFSLISTPIDKFDLKSYRLYTNNKKIYKKENQKIESEDINNIITEIDSNFNIISNLLTEKKQISNDISLKFNNKIKNKEKLSEEQMNYFKEYNDIISEEEKNISTYTSKINNKKEMISLKNELISTENNFNIIYKKLTNILNNQIKAIASLYKIIFHLRLSLSLI